MARSARRPTPREREERDQNARPQGEQHAHHETRDTLGAFHVSTFGAWERVTLQAVREAFCLLTHAETRPPSRRMDDIFAAAALGKLAQFCLRELDRKTREGVLDAANRVKIETAMTSAVGAVNAIGNVANDAPYWDFLRRQGATIISLAELWAIDASATERKNVAAFAAMAKKL